MSKSIGRGLARWLFGLLLGITLVLGFIPGIHTRVALAADPTYKITVTYGINQQTVTTDGKLDTFYTYTGSLPNDWGGFDSVTNAGSAEADAGTYQASGATFTISLKCKNVCSGEQITIRGHDKNAVDYPLYLTVDCTENTAVTVDPTTTSLDVKGTTKLTATVTPEASAKQGVTWESSDEKVATVAADGTVTGVKVGTATITATSVADTTKSATCEVTVTEPAITYSTDPASATWTPGGEGGLVFTFKRSDEEKDDTTYDHFKSLSIDGSELIRDKAYTAEKGSVIATLTPEFLDLLTAGNHTLTATFDDGSVDATLTVEESSTYTIRFDANGGTGSMGSLVVEKEATTKLPKNTFTRLGYKFVEWNLEADGSGRSYSDEDNVKVLSSGTLYAQWEKDYPAPTMSNSRGGSFTSASQEITFTVNQGVPDYAKSLVTWVDLEDVLYFSSDEVEITTTDGGTVGTNVAEVSMDDQRLTVTVDDATSLQGKTLKVSYKAKVISGADLSPYASNGIASVPYQAHTIFDGNDGDIKSSEIEYVKFRVSSGTSSGSTTSATRTPTTSSTKSSTLAKTGDPTSLAVAATMAAAGAVAVFVGRRKK